MATEVIHDHGTHGDAGTSAGLVIGIILLAVIILFFFLYGGNILNQIGSGFGTGGTNIQIPDRVDVNLNQPK
jgi:hypothetical protein